LNAYISRFEEAENRLHIIVDILSYISVQSIHICFINSAQTLNLSTNNKSPIDFQNEAHAAIANLFLSIPVGHLQPPFKGIISSLEQSFIDAAENETNPTIHYLLTDGIIRDGNEKQARDLICNRQEPSMNPITLLSCCNDNNIVKWMKDVCAAYDINYIINQSEMFLLIVYFAHRSRVSLHTPLRLTILMGS
jgi:hypothetical protein